MLQDTEPTDTMMSQLTSVCRGLSGRAPQRFTSLPPGRSVWTNTAHLHMLCDMFIMWHAVGSWVHYIYVSCSIFMLMIHLLFIPFCCANTGILGVGLGFLLFNLVKLRIDWLIEVSIQHRSWPATHTDQEKWNLEVDGQLFDQLTHTQAKFP